MVAPDLLRPHPKNPRRGNPEELALSFQANGFYGHVIAQRSTGYVLVGNHRVRGALLAGMEEIPVQWVDVVDDAHAERILVADNRTSDTSTYDEQALREILEGLAESDGGLIGTGFTESDLEALIAEVSSGVPLFRPTERVAIGDLKPHPRNYKKHPADQLEHIGASIRQNGFYRNVVVTLDGTILAGHGVVEAARLIGVATVPVVRVPLEPDSIEAIKLLALDNELAKFGEVDDRALTLLLKDIREMSADGLLGTGFTEEMLAALVMVSRPASEISGFDAAAEWVGMPDYSSGENPIKLIICFESQEARLDFLKKMELGVTKKVRDTWSTRWPYEGKDDTASVSFVTDGDDDGDDGDTP